MTTKCRFCNTELKHKLIDLINAPASNSFISKKQLEDSEVFYPLVAYVCDNCLLVQIKEQKSNVEIFNTDYLYYSSFSSSWLQHAKDYTEMITNKLKLDKNSFVCEVASNDGYLLQYFVDKKIPCIGIEPAGNTATVAKSKGIETIEDFFTEELSKKLLLKYPKANLIIGNNVIAHTPFLVDFVKGLKNLLHSQGTITLEFPHLLNLIEKNQFDTIYHEHYSYFSLNTISKIFSAHEMEIYNVEELSTHGGSLRIYAKHTDDNSKQTSNNVRQIIQKEKKAKLDSLNGYLNFQDKADKIKYELLEFLIKKKQSGKKVIAYGAAAKGNTLLNYCGIKKDLIDYVVDRSTYKQNLYMPASHIPIVNEDKIKETKPDYILILPWNIKDEIIRQLKYIKEWNAKIVVPIPKIKEL